MSRQAWPVDPARRAWVGAIAAWAWPAASAPALPQAVRRVGPGAAYATLAQAVQDSRAGDHIELTAGVHRGQVAVIDTPLSLRGLGDGAVLDAAGRHAMGKGILVVKADATVENIEFRGARVPDGNGAGIRLDSGHLIVRRCRFIDNEMGLLSSNDPTVILDIEDSVFADAPRHAGLLHHLLYAGAIARLALTGCRFENGWRGHLVKSRARSNHILCNLLRDGPQGGASYELELANGGHNVVSGNVMVQGPRTQNPTLVAVGFDADPALEHSLVFVHNTLVNEGPASARFLHLVRRRMPQLRQTLLANNLLAGPGAWPSQLDSETSGNARIDVRDLAWGDYRLRAGCLAAVDLPDAWQMLRAITPPLGSREHRPGRGLCSGALQVIG